MNRVDIGVSFSGAAWPGELRYGSLWKMRREAREVLGDFRPSPQDSRGG